MKPDRVYKVSIELEITRPYVEAHGDVADGQVCVWEDNRKNASGQIRRMSKYKEARRSGRYIEVDAKGTTQECSRCHSSPEVSLTLKDRVRSCSQCGLVLDRDINAARNILSRSLDKVSEDIGKLTPVETAPPPSRKGRRAWSRKQEPPCAMVAPFEGPSGPSMGGA